VAAADQGFGQTGFDRSSNQLWTCVPPAEPFRRWLLVHVFRLSRPECLGSRDGRAPGPQLSGDDIQGLRAKTRASHMSFHHYKRRSSLSLRRIPHTLWVRRSGESLTIPSFSAEYSPSKEVVLTGRRRTARLKLVLVTAKGSNR